MAVETSIVRIDFVLDVLQFCRITYNSQKDKRSFMAKGEYFRTSPTIFKSKIFRSSNGITSLTGEAASMKIQHVLHFFGLTTVPSIIETALR